MAVLCSREHHYTARHVTARIRHVCVWCRKPIELGTTYVLATEFPGGEAGYADYAGHPVRMRVHATQPCHYCPNPTAHEETP